MSLRWKNGASWEAISDAALYGTYGGTYHVEYPAATDVAVDGTPCGAVGKPRIIIQIPWLTDTGFDFWRDRFASTTAPSAALSIEAWDPRTGTVVKWAGILQRPTFDGISVGSSAGQTIYRNVRILVSECETTT